MATKVTVPDLSAVEVKRRGQYDAGAWYSSRGKVEFIGLAPMRLAKVSRQAGLQDRPAKLLVVPAEDGTQLFLIPVKDHPEAVTLTYARSKVSCNLSALFAYLQYNIQAGSREFHRIEFAADPVQVDDREFPALVMFMKAEEIRWEKSEAQKKAEAEKAAKEAAGKAAPTAQG